MALPPKKDHRITLADAAALTKAHRSANTGGPKAHYFDRSAFDAILAQPGCAGIRLYHAAEENGDPTLVMVGVDGSGADMTAGTLMEQAWPCPPYCDGASALQG